MFSKTDILQLLEFRGDPCVSFFMPTHRTGAQTEQDPIRFKNLLHSIVDELNEERRRKLLVGEMLRPAANLQRDPTFWNHCSDGLACFAAPDFFHAERIPIRLKSEYHILDRFFIKPLLPLLGSDQRFFILALSQSGAQLYEATPHSFAYVPLPSLPDGVDALLPERRVDASLQFHTAGPIRQRQSSGTPLYHGHAKAGQKDETDILRFFREVDQAVHAILKDEDGPLVLACVGFLASLYESVNSYRNIMRTKIPGNPDGWPEQELHKKALGIVQPWFNERHRVARRKYEDASATTLTSENIEQIVIAADDGRVETLFAAVDEDSPGSYDANGRCLRPIDTEGKDDLIDLAAMKTLENSGTVYAIEKDEVPGSGALAATFRYALPTGTS